MATWNSRGLRGSTLEDLINRTNEQYREKHLALIQKIPTPITPINIDKESRHITLAYFRPGFLDGDRLGAVVEAVQIQVERAPEFEFCIEKLVVQRFLDMRTYLDYS